MKVPEPDEERPLSWLAILENTPVYTADGEDVGGVREVVGSDAEDIFHGIVVGYSAFSRDVLLPAATITSITNKRIETSLTTENVRALEPYVEEESFHLGLVGMFTRRLGWTEDRRGPR